MSSQQAYATRSAFIAPLEGLRAVAAIGIIFTHVAFQTAMPLNSIFSRFDFFVPLFFALSAFLLWRRYSDSPRWVSYYLHRVARIFPAYLALVVGVFLFVPDAYRSTWQQILSNLTLTQIYVVDGLAPALTHLWSLSVEVAFYLVLPLVALACRRLSSQTRIAVFMAAAALSLGWPFLPIVAGSPAPGIPNLQIFPISYVSWFVVGLVAAELEGRITWQWLQHRWVFWLSACAVAWIAAQAWFGPLGLEHPSPVRFVMRVLAGALFAMLLLWPYALLPTQGILTTDILQTLGKWSFGIFLWHLPALTWVFPLLGIGVFQGKFIWVFCATLTITVPLAAASYEFIERPAAQWLRNRDRERIARPS